MKRLLAQILCMALCFSLFPLQNPAVKAASSVLPAFPGAEGFGYAALGGRGGEVYHVTSYELTGPGTFYDALTTVGDTPRTIVFDISGEITTPQIILKNKSNITIAGQTAPGDGVTIRSNNIRFYDCSNIIIRYLTFRMGELSVKDDAMYFEDCQNVIVDHSSFSWATDEVLSIKSKDYDHPRSKNITVQWSIISEALLTHSMGGLIEMNTITMHHNLYAHNNDRNPKTKGQIDFVNNVVYNWGQFPYVAGGESGTKGYGNVVGNYFIAGINSVDPQYAIVRGNENYQLYLHNNRIDSNKNGVLDGTDTGAGMMEADRPSIMVPERFGYPLVHTELPEAAYNHVLNHSGSSLARDAVDQRIVDNVRNQTGAIIGHENDVGGYPVLKKETAPADTDRDGMPDAWEQENGLNPNDPGDGNGDRNGDGYTHLEDYLNELAAAGFPASYPLTPAAWSGPPFILPAEPAPTPVPTPTASMDGKSVRNVVINDNSKNGGVNASKWSIQQNFQPGDVEYGDRSTGSKIYKLVTIPDALKGMEWIRAAMESRSSASSDLLSFYLAADADVYVVYDTRIPEIPAWLSAYEDTGETIADDQPVEYRLYKKHYSAGSLITMGANGSTSKGSYYVILKPTNPQTETPADSPSGFTAAFAAGSSVSLKWSPASDAASYLIYRSSSINNVFKAVASSNTTEYEDTAIVQGITYQYKVTALNAGGESPSSDIAEVVTFDPAQPVPPVPMGLIVTTEKSMSVGLGWTAAEGATSYSIYRAAAPEGPYHKVGSSLTAEYTDKSVSPSSAYFYKVSTVGIGGESGKSDSVSAVTKQPVLLPQIPSGISAGSVTTSAIEMQWNPVEGAERYNLYRKGNSENGYAQVGSSESADFIDDGISVTETGYSYKITAVNEMGESALSDALTIAVPVPAASSDLITGLVGQSFVGLIWAARGDATQYNIYRESVGESVYNPGSAKVGAYYDRTVKPGVEYTYYIVAQNASGESEKSNTVKVRTLGTPAVPDNTGQPEAGTSKPVLDPKTGEAKMILAIKDMTDAFDQAKMNIDGYKIITVDIPKVDGAKAYIAVLPAEFFTKTDAVRKMEIKTELGTMVVPAGMLSGATVSAKEIGLSIGIGDITALPAQVKDKIGDNPVIHLNVFVDGQKLEFNNPEKPVILSVPYKPTAEELKSPEHITVWFIDGQGNPQPMPSGRYDTASGWVTFTASHAGPYAVVSVFKTFDDLDRYAWAKDSVNILASKGIINGTGENTFEPAAAVTRADFTLLLIKTLGLTAKADSNFADLNTEDYYYEAVGIAKALGLAKGKGENRFIPEEPIARQDMMVLTARAMAIAKKLNAPEKDNNLDRFADRDEVAGYAAEELARMVEEGLINGSGGMIHPLAVTTRAEAAVLLYRVYNK